ncbi:putative ribonuclease H-like domain-containing protein [Tanacetum coccineum]|uniref:Ribonuclease H-like domain-containing protein n=1 Tax=Tanacetum coccineum TaxID=301880 RepID=A0ABQ5IR00_9ASTR
MMDTGATMGKREEVCGMGNGGLVDKWRVLVRGGDVEVLVWIRILEGFWEGCDLVKGEGWKFEDCRLEVGLDGRFSSFQDPKGANSSFVELLVMHYLKQRINNYHKEDSEDSSEAMNKTLEHQSTKTLDLPFIFNHGFKSLSQLANLCENISQEYPNLKFLRRSASCVNTHVVVWRNKLDLDTMSFDDLYNNFKIVEQEVKGNASLTLSSQNVAFVPASTQISTASTQVSTANLSDATVYAFLANQPNGSQLVHEDDLEEMDLKWQLAMLSMRTRRFFQKTGRKITINGSDTAGYDKSKVECFNCHKMGHFARECRGSRNQDNRNRNQESSRRIVNVGETSSKAMLAIDGAGFDWSYMADDEVPTNMALMAFSDFDVYNDKTCSKTYLKSFETLNTQLDDLRIEFNKSEFNLATYKRGLASVEEQLVFYKKNEVIFCKQIVVLKSDISYKDSEISMLKSELEKLKQEKESNQLKIENFDNASKSLDKLIGSQITDKSRKGVGFVSYNVVPPPPTGLFSPPNLDLSNSGLEEFQQPEFEGYGPKTSKSVSEDISNEVRESPDAPLVKELVSNDKLEKKTVFPTVAKIEFVRPKQQEKPVRKPANCNYHQRKRVVSGNNYTRVNYNYYAKKAHPSAHRNMVPRAVLMKTGLRSLNTVRPVNTAHPKTIIYSARPMSCFSKSAQSTIKRPYQIRTTLTNKNFSQKVHTTKGNFYTARLKAVNTARPNSAVVNAVRENQGHLQKEDQGYVDSGCLRHMTGNMSYLSEFKEFDRGYVIFGGGAKGGKITGKMCDKKNRVLFTDTGCFVLSLDFKLADKSQVLLKVPRKNNMYSVDMKNIVPKESLTCLVAKATLDESMLWHRRLGHVNFKTINKLVKENLVRGLPAKRFENDQTCVACLKGKQHKASFVTDDYSRFTWVFFLASKDETSSILRSFITEIENLVDKKVKIIRYDNGTKFKNRVMNEFCEKKGIKREFSVARAPQQNGVAERRNRTLIEAARTMLADSKGRTPSLSFMRPFGCHVTILNTLDHLGKFDGKSDDGFFVGYSLNSKAFRVYNIRTRKVEENLHVRFLEDKPIIAGDGPKWLFDIDVLTKSMNYVPVVAGTNSNDSVGTEESAGTDHSSEETGSSQDYILMPLWKDGSLFDSSSKNASNDEPQPSNDAGKKDDEGGIDDQERTENSAQDVNTAGPSINTASTNFNTGSLNINTVSPTVPTTLLESTYADFFGDESELDLSNIATTYLVPSTLNTRIHTDHSLDHVIGDVKRQEGIQALKDPRWIEAMQEEILQFKLQQVWTMGYTQEEGIDYDEMDVKSTFLYGNIEEEVYVCQPPGFEDPEFSNKVYKVEKALYGLHQAPRAWYETLSTYLLDNGFQRGQIDKALFIKRVKAYTLLGTASDIKNDGIFISQDKYVEEILKKFGFLTVKTKSTPMETSKPLLKDAKAEDVDFDVLSKDVQVTPKVSHLHAMKRIFRYLKGQPKLGLWYPKDLPFDLKAYTNSDYAGASLDMKSTIGGCQFLGRRLISWQYKKQTIVANSTTEAEYVAATSCFKNPVFHSKTKHIEIKHHFIRDSNEKKLIQMIKIHTNQNVADLLTKAFDVGRFQYLIASIGCKYWNA